LTGLIARLGVVMIAATALFLSAGLAAADGTEVGIDAVTEGNSATELGPINGCVEAATGDEVTVDLYIKDVEDLLAWQMWLQYDPAVLALQDRDVEQFLATADDSNVFDASDQTPDTDGRYLVQASNVTDSSKGISGSGVLAHITFEAVGPGIAEIDLRAEDIDDNGAIDRGPFLNNVEPTPIGDTNNDTFFDGTLRNGAIAVDADCGDAEVTVSGGDDGASALPFILGGAAAAVLVLAAATAIWVRRRGRAVTADS
jgi:hypothetical protein